MNLAQPQIPRVLNKGYSGIDKIIALLQTIRNSNNPQLITTRRILLIILLCLTVYFIIQLTHNFFNSIVLAFLSGVAYCKLRQKFVNFWKRENKQSTKADATFFIKNLFYLLLFISLPWISHLNQSPFNQLSLGIQAIMSSFCQTSNLLVRITQVLLFCKIMCNICKNQLNRYIFVKDMSKKTQKVLNICLVIIVVIVLLFLLVLFVTTIAMQLSNAAVFMKKSVEDHYNCYFFIDENIKTQKYNMTHCKQIIPQSFKDFIPQIQNQTLQDCMNRLTDIQTKYLGHKFLLFQYNICMGISIIQKVNPKILQTISNKPTSIFLNILSGFFGVIVNIFAFLSNSIFQFTTFLSVFIATASNYQSTDQRFRFFGEAKAQLIKQITAVIEATIFIALQHLAFSIALLQIFNFSSINILLSIFLSLLAFIPYVKPSFVMILVTVINIMLRGGYVSSILCAVLYWVMSEYIYNRHYSDVGLHKLVINLSVVFGIYQFGFFGIFYGPLLLILFQCIYDELFK